MPSVLALFVLHIYSSTYLSIANLLTMLPLITARIKAKPRYAAATFIQKRKPNLP
jgi:hypothetical protein